MTFAYAIDSIEFSGGSNVVLPREGVTLLVGPNNVGKSRTLREVAGRIGLGTSGPYLVTRSVQQRREGTAHDFVSWLATSYELSSTPPAHQVLTGVGIRIVSGGPMKDLVASRWIGSESLHEFAQTVASYLDTSRRLAAAEPVHSYDAVKDRPSEMLHQLYADEHIEARIGASFRRAFGTDLVVDRHGGSQIALRCGERPNAQALGGHLSMPFARAVRALPGLHEQGDGMRSYVACLLHTDVLQRPVVFIDEPEAFLHPPQARELARHLSRAAKRNGRQVIIATHSADIVRGTLDGGVDVSVVRLTRGPDGANIAQQLDAATIRRLWEDPLLRASNLLDALFHQRLVLCEADGDCRFYNAVMEALTEDSSTSRADVMFAHTGGKDRLPTAVSAMRAVGVPVSVVADLDVLNAEKTVRSIWEGLGGVWDDVSVLRRRVASGVESSVRRVPREYFRQRVLELLESSHEAALDDATLNRIRALLKSDGGWQSVKSGGMDMIPKGEARAAADELRAIFSARGFHLVPVGELEGFAPHLGGHGPGWVAKALTMDLKAGAEAAQAREFVRSLGIA